METRPNHPNGCVYCGECMAGCFRGAVYSTRHQIRQYLRQNRIERLIEGRVIHIDPERRVIRYAAKGQAIHASS